MTSKFSEHWRQPSFGRGIVFVLFVVSLILNAQINAAFKAPISHWILRWNDVFQCTCWTFCDEGRNGDKDHFRTYDKTVVILHKQTSVDRLPPHVPRSHVSQAWFFSRKSIQMETTLFDLRHPTWARTTSAIVRLMPPTLVSHFISSSIHPFYTKKKKHFFHTGLPFGNGRIHVSTPGALSPRWSPLLTKPKKTKWNETKTDYLKNQSISINGGGSADTHISTRNTHRDYCWSAERAVLVVYPLRSTSF